MRWRLILFVSSMSLGVMLLIVRSFLVIVTVKGQSMSPTLIHRDQVLVLRYWAPQWLRKGQIVIVWPWQQMNQKGKSDLFKVLPYIKRVVGLPKDRLITKITDLEEHERPYYSSLHNKKGERVWEIPEGHFFVRGDYPISGNDSLVWGAIPFRCLLGIVLVKLPYKAKSDELLD